MSASAPAAAPRHRGRRQQAGSLQSPATPSSAPCVVLRAVLSPCGALCSLQAPRHSGGVGGGGPSGAVAEQRQRRPEACGERGRGALVWETPTLLPSLTTADRAALPAHTPSSTRDASATEQDLPDARRCYQQGGAPVTPKRRLEEGATPPGGWGGQYRGCTFDP